MLIVTCHVVLVEPSTRTSYQSANTGDRVERQVWWHLLGPHFTEAEEGTLQMGC